MTTLTLQPIPIYKKHKHWFILGIVLLFALCLYPIFFTGLVGFNDYLRALISIALIWDSYELLQVDRLLKYWRIKTLVRKLIYLFVGSAVCRIAFYFLPETFAVATTLSFFLILGAIIRERRTSLAEQWNKYHETEEKDVLSEGIEVIESAKAIVANDIKNSKK